MDEKTLWQLTDAERRQYDAITGWWEQRVKNSAALAFVEALSGEVPLSVLSSRVAFYRGRMEWQ